MIFWGGFGDSMIRLLAALIAAALALGAVSIAEAQQAPQSKTKRTAAAPGDPGPGATTVISRDEQGRVRTKILVQKRSYLDGGTEVMPGDMSGTNRDTLINSFSYNPSRASVSNDNVVPSRPIPDPFFLPGKNNPFFN
jgi:hypothetical protein